MKKILSILAIIGLVAPTTSSIISFTKTSTIKNTNQIETQTHDKDKAKPGQPSLFTWVVELNTHLKKTDLGKFNYPPTEQEVLIRAKSLNSLLKIEELYVDGMTIKAFPGSSVYKGEVEISYLVLEDLHNIIEQTMLGNFENQPTNQEILERLKELNPRLDINEVYMERNFVKAFPKSDKYFGYSEVEYDINSPRDLKNILTKTNLGVFDSKPTALEILERAKKLNPSLDIDEVYVRGYRIAAFPRSPKYSGIVDISYLVLEDLNKVILNTNLGNFDYEPDEDEILTRVLLLNPNLDDYEVYVLGDLIKAVPRSEKYKGQVQISYTVNLRVELESVLTNTNLDVFNHQPSDEELLKILGEKNPELDINEVYLEGDVVKAKADSIKYKGQVQIHYVVDLRVELSSVVTVTHLGDFDHEPSLEEIMAKIVELNPELDVNEVHFDGFLVKANFDSTKYKGEVQLSGNVDLRLDLAMVIETTDLGIFYSLPTGEELIERLKELNPNLDVNEILIEQNMVKPVDGSVKYKGEVAISYTLDLRLDLGMVIENTDLGEFDYEPTSEELLVRLKEMNSNLDLSEVYLDGNLVKANEGSALYKGEVAIDYVVDLRIHLADVVIHSFLGIFDHDPNDEEKLVRVGELNPELDLNEVYIENTNLKAKADSTKYKGEVPIAYMLDSRLDLATVISNIDLGTFENQPSVDDLKEKLLELNPNLDISQVEITNMTDSEATILAVLDSEVYKGQVVVNYQLDLRQFLVDVITSTNLGIVDLGSFEENDEALIAAIVLEKVNQLNPELDVSEVEVSDVTFNSLTVLAKADSTKYKGSVIVSFESVWRVDLSEVITNTDLGTFDHQPNEQEILAKVKELNPELFSSQVHLDGKIVRANADSADYKGEVAIDYVVDLRIELITVIETTDLGTFTSFPSEAELLAKLGELNPNLDLNEVYLENNFVKANLDSEVYKGEVAISYTLDERIDLASIVTNIDLGVFTHNPSDEELLAKLQELNPDLDINEVHIVEDYNLKANVGSTIYKGELTIRYVIDLRIDLTALIQNTDLGTFAFEPTKLDLLTKLMELNPELDLSEVYIEGTMVKANLESTKYKGEVAISYTVDLLVELATVVETTDLGIFYDEPTSAELLAKLVELNPDLDISQVEISFNNNNQTGTLVANNESTKYKGQVDFNYEIDLRIDISQIDAVIDLGIFNHVPNEEDVLNKFGELNPSLDLNELEVHFNVFVKAKDESTKYKGEVQVRFSIDLREDLAEELVNTNLGILSKMPTAGELLNKVHELNPNVKIAEVKVGLVKNGTAQLEVMESSEIYRPTTKPIVVTFKVGTLHPGLNISYVSSVINTDADTDYPYKNEYATLIRYIDGNTLFYSKTITFTTIDLEQDYSYDDVNAFFEDYEIEFDYDWFGNTWASDSGWSTPGGKYYSQGNWSKTKQKFSSVSDTGVELTGTDAILLDEAFENTYGSFETPQKGKAYFHVWMEITGSTIEIKGQVAGAYDDSGSDRYRAVFGVMQGRGLKVIAKK